MKQDLSISQLMNKVATLSKLKKDYLVPTNELTVTTKGDTTFLYVNETPFVLKDRAASQLSSIDRKFRIHDMRHTHATWLLESGVNIKAVSERLGHSSIRITLDTYAHVGQSMQEEAVKALNNLL